MLTNPAPFFLGVIILVIVIWDAFEVIILPRRVTRRFRVFQRGLKDAGALFVMVLPGQLIQPFQRLAGRRLAGFVSRDAYRRCAELDGELLL